MRIKSWRSSIIKSIINAIRIRPNRSARRRWQIRCYARATAALLAVAASVPLLGGTAAGQCDGPLFPGQTFFAAGDTPYFVTTGDFDGDGLTDLVTANEVSDNVSVLLGNGDGTFQAQQTFAAGDRPRSVTTGDFNGDGLTDLATANLGSDDVSVLLGNGDGTFQAQQTFAGGGLSVTTGDFNGDGLTDLATAGGDVSVLLGNGDGTFQAQQTFAVGDSPVSVTTADFNGDGLTDLATTNSTSVVDAGTVSVLLGNGDGTFQARQTFAAGDRPWTVTTGDFNGDGLTDLATANVFSYDVSVLLGNGDGTFQAQQTFALGVRHWTVTTGDFDGDGLTDLAAANSSYDNVSVLLGNGDGTFQAQQTFAAGDAPRSITTGDFNGDGLTDLATANRLSDDVSVLLNQCTSGGVVEVAPDSFTVTRGIYVAGDETSLAASDNVDLSLQRLGTDVQSRTEFEVTGTSPTASPASLDVVLEGAVFARSQVNQTIELWDYVAGAWELVETRNATNMVDSTATVAATGDLSRFVDPTTLSVKARIRYQSPVARQRFASNTDQFIWMIGQ